MDAETKLAIWNAANKARREAGQCELLMWDFRAFLGDFEKLAVEFDATFSELALAQKEARDAA